MKTLVLALLLSAPLMAAEKPIVVKGYAVAVSKPMTIHTTGGVAALWQWIGSTSRAVFWVSPDGCVWDHTDASKPARKLGCLAKPEALQTKPTPEVPARAIYARPAVLGPDDLPCRILTSNPPQASPECDEPLMATSTPSWTPAGFAPGLAMTVDRYAPGLSGTPTISEEAMRRVADINCVALTSNPMQIRCFNGVGIEAGLELLLLSVPVKESR